MPLEFGKWEAAYKRWRLWQANGLWPRLLALLDDAAIDESTQVTL
jgi:transposase